MYTGIAVMGFMRIAGMARFSNKDWVIIISGFMVLAVVLYW